MNSPTKIMLPLTVMIFLMFPCCSKKTQPQNDGTTSSFPPNKNSVSSAPKKLALLVGINEYRSPQLSDLAGCVNDIERMKALLIGKFEFPAENIVVLTNEKATHAAIIEAFQNHLIAKAGPEDIVVVHYSGHGSQMEDNSGDEVDGLDETIIPHDSRQGNVFDLSDDELNGLLRLLSQKTKNITFIFDSCNSGTITRASGRPRKAPADNREPPSPPDYAWSERGVSEGENDLRPQNLNYVLISGCRTNESSHEYSAHGKKYGALTYFLTQELHSAGAAATYRDVMDNVMGKVNAVYSSQHPQLEGVVADYYVFSDSTSMAQPYILTSPLGKDKVTLSAGQVHGLTAGSIFEVYKPGTKKFADPEKPIAKVELTKVEAFTSEGKMISGKQVPPFSRAIERQHQYPDLKLHVYYDGLPQSATLRSIKAELDKFDFIETVPQARGYHLLLRQAGNEMVTEGGNATEVSPRAPASDPNVVKRVVNQVTQWARWFNILSIANPAPAFNVKFTIKAVRDGKTRAPFEHIGRPDAVLYEGEQIECKVQNTRPGRNLYLAILDLAADGSVALIYPSAPGAAEYLPPLQTQTMRFETYVPEGRNSVKDILKVFATAEPIDFKFLIQEPVRGGEKRDLPATMNDPLSQFLANAFLGRTRDVRPVNLGIWATAQRVIEVRRRP